MSILGGILGDLIKPVSDLVSEVVVDKDKRNEINYKLQELADAGDARVHDQVLAQLEVNKTEAQHGSIFVAGWRPFIGWVSGVGLATQAIILPLVGMIWGLTYTLDTTLLITTLAGMLGIGGMRTYEKVRGVSTNTYKDVPKAKEPENLLPPIYAAKLPEDAPWVM